LENGRSSKPKQQYDYRDNAFKELISKTIPRGYLPKKAYCLFDNLPKNVYKPVPTQICIGEWEVYHEYAVIIVEKNVLVFLRIPAITVRKFFASIISSQNIINALP